MAGDQLTHWENWATTFKQNLRATTKTQSIKELEIRELIKAMDEHIERCNLGNRELKILEIGCGNGYNVFALARHYKNFDFHGIDFSSSMIDNANKNLTEQKELNNCKFYVGDAKNLGACEPLFDEYDIIFTNRCLINLKEDGDIDTATSQINERLNQSGCAIFIENFIEGRDAQNRYREELGLEARPIPEFNRFLNKEEFTELLNSSFKEVKIECISSLHDFILYVLSPFISSEKSVDYDNPISKAAAVLLRNNDIRLEPDIGQNYIAVATK